MPEQSHLGAAVPPQRPRPVIRRPAVSVGSIGITVTLRPADELPGGVGLEDVLEELADLVAELADDWFERRGRRFLETAPIVV